MSKEDFILRLKGLPDTEVDREDEPWRYRRLDRIIEDIIACNEYAPELVHKIDKLYNKQGTLKVFFNDIPTETDFLVIQCIWYWHDFVTGMMDSCCIQYFIDGIPYSQDDYDFFNHMAEEHDCWGEQRRMHQRFNLQRSYEQGDYTELMSDG